MPIHTSWKSMASSIIHNANYCKRNPKRRCYKMTDGKKLCGCAGGWGIFFATLRKRGWDETKPRPKKVSQTVFDESVREVFDEIILREWYFSETSPTLTSDNIKGLVPPKVIPPKVLLWKKACESPKTPKQLKAGVCQKWWKWLKVHGKKKTEETVPIEKFIDWLVNE